MARSIAARQPRRIASRRAPTPSSAPLRRAPAALAGRARASIALVLGRRRLRVALLCLAISTSLLAGGWLWFRGSSFVAIERVQISGVGGVDAGAVEAALTHAAQGMTTLEVSDGALLAATTPLHLVREVHAVASFPHAVHIEVVEQPPVASLTVGGVRTAVAADGVVLGPGLASGSLPSVSGEASGDGAAAPAAGGRVRGAGLLGELAVLGAAPGPLARHIERVFTGAKGLTVAMRNGLLVYFGDGTRPHAKWLSLARVLADPTSAGASYIDVRLPSHPAAGFPPGVAPPAASGAGATGADVQSGASESTVAALAAALPGGAAAASASGESSAASGAGAGSSPAGEAAQTQAAAAPAAAPGAQGEATGTPPAAP